MFVHIGKEKSILYKDIVAIISLQTEGRPDSTAEFLTTSDEEGFLISLTDKPRSLIVTSDKVFLSPISSVTLCNRVKTFIK